MAENTIGVTFRETMTGGFALGESDPREGERKGRADGTMLALHANVAIPDLDRFISDPEHLGELSGSIEFGPFGGRIPGANGVFNLFSPSDAPKMKLMVYELGFEHEGKQYYLAGRKEVRDDPGFDVLSDTTTLYTTLHEGTDRTGPVAGAGVLSLGMGDLAALTRTIRVTGTRSRREQAAALASFGRFFVGELWDTHLGKALSPVRWWRWLLRTVFNRA